MCPDFSGDVSLPELSADVAVVGGGPGGAATALALARGGARVVVLDKATFPRDKVCGDGLLPDAWREIERLSVAPAVAPIAHTARGIAFRAPGGRRGFVPVASRVARRFALDVVVLDAARDAGAEVLEGATLVAMEGTPGKWRAALVDTSAGSVRVEAGRFVLAAGAAPRLRALVGLDGRTRLGGAVRAYATGLDLDETELVIHFREELPSGYFWAFPVGGGTWNVGCGSFAGANGGSLVDSAVGFAESFGGVVAERPRGAPLGTWFPRFEVARGNVLAVGDAAGLTRPFSGEGIGPALLSGTLAASCLLGGGQVARAYDTRLRRHFAREFTAWRLGERLLAYPRVVDVMVGRVEGSHRARSRIKAVLASSAPTGSVLSPLGIARILLGR